MPATTPVTRFLNPVKRLEDLFKFTIGNATAEITQLTTDGRRIGRENQITHGKLIKAGYLRACCEGDEIA